MTPDVHPQEAARLGALRRYAILDTPFERDYDDVVDIARRICGTPASTITFIDEGRQWFKAVVGLGNRDGPLKTSLCAHAILADDFVEISDTWEDPRTSDNPLCVNVPGCRFYAGVVLRTGDGLPIGTLCVLDFAPRVLDDLQRDTLRLLGAQVMHQLDLRATLVQAEMLRREIDHRVKNSLQSVGAFVRLQRRAATNIEVTATLQAVEQQIEAVALLHDLISEATGEQLELGDYLDRLTALLAMIVPAGIAVTGRFAPLAAGPAVATAIGTIVNELVANAVKHSFAAGDRGQISLTGAHDDTGNYQIECRDDGPATTPAVSTPRDGLGLKIMTASIRQLNGAIVGEQSASGYCSRVTFPAPALALPLVANR